MGALRRTLALAGTLGAAAGCGEAPVVVETRVSTQPSDPEPSDDAVWVVDEATVRGALLRAIQRVEGALEGARADASGKGADADRPADGSGAPSTEAELQRLFEVFAHAPIEDLGGPAGRLRAADPSLLEPLAARLLRPRTRPKSEYRTVLGLVGGDVPNRYGTFLLHWKKRHGHPVRVSEDWYRDLLALEPARVGRPLRPVLRDCIETVALAWAVANIGRTSPERADRATAILLDAAYVHFGTFRDEVGRALRSMGDAAVPTLVRASRPPEGRPRNREQEIAHRKATYAQIQLDLLDRGHPGRVFAAFSDQPDALVRVVEAYADRKDPEAAASLVALVDHDDPRVRAAARKAVVAYVSGPPPTVRKREIRLLGGIVERRRAAVDHRTKMALGIEQKLEEVAPDGIEPPCELRRDDGTWDTACLGRPVRLARILFERLDAQRAARRRSVVAELREIAEPAARARAIDRALVEDPGLGEVPEFVDLLVADAREAGRDRPARAAVSLRRAAVFVGSADPDRSARLHALAGRLEAEVTRDGWGDATDVRARGAARTAKVTEQAWLGAGGVFLGLLCFGALTGPARRRT